MPFSNIHAKVCHISSPAIYEVNGNTPMTDPAMKELTEISLMAEEYEHEHYSMNPLTLVVN